MPRRVRNDVSLAVKAINRAALANVPIVGTTITTLMGVYGAEYQQRRIDTLAEELAAVMKVLGTKVDQSFLKRTSGRRW